MSNVKPGDLAVVIADPMNQGTLGVQVLVVGPARPRDIHEYDSIVAIEKAGGSRVWECEALQSRHFLVAYDTEVRTPKLIRPGDHVWVSDRVLRRIEPPADAMDLLSTEPLAHEDDVLPPETREALREFVEGEVDKLLRGKHDASQSGDLALLCLCLIRLQ